MTDIPSAIPVQRTGRKRSKQNLGLVISGALVGVIVLVSVFAPILFSLDPLAQDIGGRFAPIGSADHLLGTDNFGRDTLTRMIYGIRTEVWVCGLGSLLAVALGSVVGLIAGYFGRWSDTLLMRLTDVLLAFPALVLALLIVTLYRAGNVTVIIVCGFAFAPQFTRLVYGQVIGMRKLAYVESARVFGGTRRQVLLGVLLPNIAPTILAQYCITIALAISLESGLSFLGLGIVPPEPSLGLMIADARRYFRTYPTQLLIPCILIVVLVLAFGYLGDLLRDRLDPRS